MAYFSDRIVSFPKLIIAAAAIYAGAVTFAHAAGGDVGPAQAFQTVKAAPSSDDPYLAEYNAAIERIAANKIQTPETMRVRLDGVGYVHCTKVVLYHKRQMDNEQLQYLMDKCRADFNQWQ